MGRSCGLSRVAGSNSTCSTIWGSSSMAEQPPQGVFPQRPLPIRFSSRRVSRQFNRNPQPRRPYGKPRPRLGRIQFRNHQQTSQRFPIRNASETWRARRSWGQRASREARSQRPLPVWFRTQVLRSVACAPDVTTAVGRITFFRE